MISVCCGAEHEKRLPGGVTGGVSCGVTEGWSRAVSRAVWRGMDTLCGLSLCACILREQDELKGRTWWVVTVAVLLVLYSLRRYLPPYRHLLSPRGDTLLRATITGALTGGMCFLSEIQDDIGYIGFMHQANRLYYLEIAYIIPVFLSTVICINRMCERNVCSRRVPTVIIGVLIFEVGLAVLLGFLGKIHSPLSLLQVKNSLAVSVVIFLVAMFLCTPWEQVDVLIAWIAIYLNFIWQTSCLDRSAWNSSLARYPVPGGLSVFIWINLREAQIPPTQQRNAGSNTTTLYGRTAFLQTYTSSTYITNLQRIYQTFPPVSPRGLFVVCFAAARLFLPYKFSFVRYSEPEKWANVLIIILIFYFLNTTTEKIGKRSRRTANIWNISAVLAIIFHYFCHSIGTRHPTNSYFYDAALGFALSLVTIKLDKQTPGLHAHERNPSDVQIEVNEIKKFSQDLSDSDRENCKTGVWKTGAGNTV